MKKLKILILFIILAITVGIAAVSSNLLINGSTPIASNPDDFNVYFSDVLVNGTQDLSLVTSETSLVFTGEFSAVGDKKEITYDVTNASKNYDADIDITCTQSTEYLTITNSFDTSINLAATSTRTGVLTITLSKSYTGADLTQDISCTISASAVGITNQGSGTVAEPVELFYIGKEVSIGEEVFNVISVNDEAVTLLAQYNVGDAFAQIPDKHYVAFSNEVVGDDLIVSNNINLQTSDLAVSSVVNGYADYIKSIVGDVPMSASLLTISDLKALGCSVNVGNYMTTNETCTSSQYKSWLVNGQQWWTRSTSSSSNAIRVVCPDGGFDNVTYSMKAGVRPTITIYKDTILSLNNDIQYDVGHEITIENEKFNVIGQSETMVFMFAQKNLNTQYRQADGVNNVVFSSSTGWDYTPGPLEVDISTWSSTIDVYIDNYVSYLKTAVGSSLISGDLITLSELGELDCWYSETYESSMDKESMCRFSSYKDWLINGQDFWTRSAVATDADRIWYMEKEGYIYNVVASVAAGGVRPVISISKNTLNKFA